MLIVNLLQRRINTLFLIHIEWNYLLYRVVEVKKYYLEVKPLQ